MPSPILFEAQWWNPLSWDDAPLIAVVAALWVIVMLRANATYWLGRAIATGTARTKWRKMLESEHYETGHRWLERWGAPAVTVSFLTIGIQTMVNLAAGVMRMSMKKYLPAVAIGSVLWAVMYGTIGFVGWVAIERLWTISPWLVLAATVAVTTGIVIYFKVGRNRGNRVAGTSETTEAE